MNSRTTAVFAVLLTAYLAWGAVYIHRTSFVIDGERVFCLWDDAMISMRYASNWAAGGGLVWNAGGERVQGFSNPAVTVAMAGLHLLPVDEFRISLLFQIANLLALAALPLLIWRLALDCFGQDRWIAGSAALATTVCAPLAIWGLQGADTTAVTLWLLVALVMLGRASRGEPCWPRGLFLWLGAGMWIRLDTAVFSAVFLAASWWYPGPASARLLRGAVILALFPLILFALGALYYGDPLPNTYYLKATGTPFGLMLAAGLEQLVAFSGAIPALVLATNAVARLRSQRVVLLCAALVVAALCYHLRVGGDWLAEYGGRFLVPVLPIVSMLAAAGSWLLLRDLLPRALAARTALRSAALAVAVVPAVLANPSMAFFEWLDPGASTMLRGFNSENAEYGVYFREFTDPSTTLGVHWGGVSPYFSGRPAVDVLGKSDRHIAKLEVDRFVPGHSKWDWDYVLREKKPDIFVLHSRGLDQRADFRETYVRVNNAAGLPFYLRKESAAKLNDPDAILVDQITGLPYEPGAA